MDNMDRIRLKNLYKALEKATDAADRCASNGSKLDPTFVDRVEDMMMEVGMLLADADDGLALPGIDVARR